MARMFIALSAETREVRLAAAGYPKVLNGLLPGVGFRSEPSLHITLRFLGEVGPDTVVELREQLRDISINHKGMKLTLEGVGDVRGQQRRIRRGVRRIGGRRGGAGGSSAGRGSGGQGAGVSRC